MSAIEPLLLRYAQLVDKDGKAITTQGAPTYGTAWTGAASLSGLEIKGEGQAPSGPDQIAIDAATADREDYAVGDTIEVITDVGQYDLHDHGARGPRRQRRVRRRHVGGVGRPHGIGGARCRRVLRRRRRRRGRRHRRRPTVQARLEQILPEGTEVVTRDVLIAEGEGDVSTFINAFQNVLLGFAFVTAFVSAFLINNVFQITIGQRLRELALLRAVGAVGPPGAPDDLRRGADHGDPRHGAGDRRRHLRGRVACSASSTPPAPGSPIPARCSRRAR